MDWRLLDRAVLVEAPRRCAWVFRRSNDSNGAEQLAAVEFVDSLEFDAAIWLVGPSKRLRNAAREFIDGTCQRSRCSGNSIDSTAQPKRAYSTIDQSRERQRRAA